MATGADTRPIDINLRMSSPWSVGLVAGVLLACSAVLLLAWASGGPRLPNDDAYIILHSAESLNLGYDKNFAGTPALYGITAELQVFLVALLLHFLPGTWALYAANIVGAIAYAGGAATLARRYGADSMRQFGCIALALIAGGAIFHLANGMETGFAMAAVFWTLAAVEAPRPRLWHAALYGVLPFIRPELAALSGTAGLMDIWRLGSDRKSVALFLVIALAMAIPLAAILFAQTGYPYPTTVFSKPDFAAQGLQPLSSRLDQIGLGLWRFIAMAGPLAVFALFLRGRVLCLFLIFAATFLIAYLHRYPAALVFYMGRYCYVLLPFFLAGFMRFLGASKMQRPVIGAVAFICLAGAAISTARLWPEYHRDLASEFDSRDNLVQWARDNLPAGSKILIHDAGYIACATDFQLVDLTGLKTPSADDLHKRLTAPSGGARRGEVIDMIARAAKPGYLIATGEWDRTYEIETSLARRGWGLTLLYRAGGIPGLHPEEAYEIYALTAPAQ